MALSIRTAVPPGFKSTLATPDEAAVERLALRIIEDARVRAARADARRFLEDNPLSQLADGKARLDIALDAWINFFALQEANSDPDRPIANWVCNSSAYTWFGHTVPVSGGSIDNPDNIYRLIPLHGDARYEIRGQMRPMHSAQFTFQLLAHDNIIPRGNDNTSLGMVHSRDAAIGPDGAFTVTVDSHPAGGRPNHIRAPSGQFLRMVCRDTTSSWLQNPNALTVQRVGGPPLKPAPNEATVIERVALGLMAWVRGWLDYVAQFAGPPPENMLVKPYGRAGAWGYISPMRFRLADDEAMVVTIDDGASDYAAIQITDVWTIAPDPQKFVFSYTNKQSHLNDDGTYTYVIAVKDPGAANWIDTAGMHQGWVAIRWQDVPRTRTSSDGLLRDVRVVKSSDLVSLLPAAARGMTSEQRKREVKQRTDDWRLRLATG
jgi:hypothetical protein